MYTNYCGYGSKTDNGETSKFNIERCKRIVKETEAQIEDLNYKLKLYKLDKMNTVKCSVTYYELFGFNNIYIINAKKWLNIIKEKYDKRKKYSERTCYEILQDNISKYLFDNKEIKITSISQLGWEGYCDIITFICEDMEFSIYVPSFKSIEIDNFEYAYEGKLAIYVRTSRCNIMQIACDYDENVLLENIKNFFKDKENINKLKEKFSIETA